MMARWWSIGTGLAVLAGPAPMVAQEAGDRDAVVAVVEGLFAAMARGDTAEMRRLLLPEARVIQTGTRNGQPFYRLNTVDGFLGAIGSAAPRRLEERIRAPEVRLDDHLATVWAAYDFFVDGQRTHCGVDSYQLIRRPEGWRLMHIIDTQRQTCTG